MIDHWWTILCSRAVVDQRSNNVSLQNILEQITIRGELPTDAAIPAIPMMCELVTLWARQPADTPTQGRARITYLAPSGEELHAAEVPIDLSETQRYRTQLTMQGLRIAGPGVHTFRVELQDNGNWREVSAVPLEIIVEPPDPAESDE